MGGNCRPLVKRVQTKRSSDLELVLDWLAHRTGNLVSNNGPGNILLFTYDIVNIIVKCTILGSINLSFISHINYI
jgi:hypothetical protein